MLDKTILITGATSVIGRVAAKSIAARGAKMILIAKDESKVLRIIDNIKTETRNNNLDYYICDLSSQKEINKLADNIKNKYSKLDVLINNAGLIINEHRFSADGYEYTFALDHLAYFILTGLLLDLLKTSSNSRIVNVSSAAHLGGNIDFADLMGEKKYSPGKAYCQAKLANVLFTYELSKRLTGSNITVNCLQPGTVRTGFGSDLTGVWGIAMKMLKPFLISPEMGAQTLIYLATSPEIENITGKYFYKKTPKASSKKSYNSETSILLWNISEKLTNFKYNISF